MELSGCVTVLVVTPLPRINLNHELSKTTYLTYCKGSNPTKVIALSSHLSMLDQHFRGAFHAHFNATDGLYLCILLIMPSYSLHNDVSIMETS